MKNVHIIPTDKPSRLYSYKNKLGIANRFQCGSDTVLNQNIYITSNEEIKEGDWFYSVRELIEKAIINYPKGEHFGKIILTTDQDLIKDGIQSIDDEFLKWFVAHPTCEEVEIGNQSIKSFDTGHFEDFYKTIIPREEPKQDFPMQKLIDIMENDEELRPKQETLEEIIERESEIRYPVLTHNNPSDSPYIGIQKTFKHGVKFGIELQQERSHSEEEVLPIIEYIQWVLRKIDTENTPEEIVRLLLFEKDKIEQFKKK